MESFYAAGRNVYYPANVYAAAEVPWDYGSIDFLNIFDYGTRRHGSIDFCDYLKSLGSYGYQ